VSSALTDEKKAHQSQLYPSCAERVKY